MLKATRPTRKPKPPARTSHKKPAAIPPENLRVLAVLDQWKRMPVSDEERLAWEETKKSLDEGRPHRPLFS